MLTIIKIFIIECYGHEKTLKKVDKIQNFESEALQTEIGRPARE